MAKNSSSLSIFIICKNEEKIIAKTLSQARKLADEIILVDSGSKDKTLEIAREFACKISYHNWEGYGKQKNYAMSLCKNEWLLSLDADEIMTDGLIQEIKFWLSSNPEATVFKIPRKLFIGDKFIRWGAFYPDHQLRLFKRNSGLFTEVSVHEGFKPKDTYVKIVKLQYPLEHFAYDSVEDLEKTFYHYARLFEASRRGFILALTKSIYTFCYKYFFRLGFLDAGIGLKLALINAKYSFMKYENRL